ncbi:MAG: dual specificity protein phosphatase family protein [Dehalococcoidia bacterium]|nr:dual specificity protein phosphatase family protein [Dehalococcoidia bacterium]
MLEEPSLQLRIPHDVPRASLVLAAGEADNPHTEVWMGGARSYIGDHVSESLVTASWLVDCAGDMPAAHRAAAGLWVACVFADHDGPLPPSLRIDQVVADAAHAARGDRGEPPRRIYVMCTHGMNRSGLVTGLILRSLGIDGRDAVERIRLARPGALSNFHFRDMLLYS